MPVCWNAAVLAPNARKAPELRSGRRKESRKSRRTLRSAAPRVPKSIAYECTPPRSL